MCLLGCSFFLSLKYLMYVLLISLIFKLIFNYLYMETQIQPIPNLKNILTHNSLKWVFVGGKGGVGKTTVSASLAIQLAQNREKVLIVSTDPAHSLSDAFDQKLDSNATLIKGFTNLYGLEIDPKNFGDEDDMNFSEVLGTSIDEDTQSIFNHLKNSLPGIDEALCISLLFQAIEKMDFNIVVFDTAPTGHTLHMLQFPSILEQGLNNLTQSASSGMGGMITTMLNQTLGNGMGNIMDIIKTFKESVENIHKEFINKNHTTFIAVCIPEFLSMYETGRLLQELEKEEIDCHNIVINQVIFPEPNCDCEMCNARFSMQKKYILQIIEGYEDEGNIHISILPFLENEIRGNADLMNFTKYLI